MFLADYASIINAYYVGPVHDLIVAAWVSPQILFVEHHGLSDMFKAYLIIEKKVSVFCDLLHHYHALH